MSLWNRKRFGIAQRHRRLVSFQEAYHVRDADTDQNIAWAKRKRFGIKTDILVWETDQMGESNAVLRIKDNALFDAFGNYTIIDERTGEPLAILNRHYIHSLVREKWTIRYLDGREIVTVIARSLLISLIRNFRWLPIFGSLDFFIQFIRLQWDFKERQSGKIIGYFDRKLTLRDNYILDFSGDTDNFIDPRVGLAMGLILDSGEDR